VTTICLPNQQAQAAVGELPGVHVVIWDGSGAPPPGIEDVEVLVPAYAPTAMTEQALAAMPRLRVIQLLSAGVEPWLDRVPSEVILCSGRGVHGASTAELAVAGLLSVLRELPRFYAAQAAHRWAKEDSDNGDGIDGKSVLVLGAGDIGHRVATAVEALGATVTLVARRARNGVRPMTELADLLPGHDVAVVAMPHTPETHHLVDAAFLAALPDGAVLVNVARGQIVDTDALLAELTARRLRAFLDVTDPEPLPEDHPLWDAPNLVITPHVGGGTRGWERRAFHLVREQVIRFQKGAPLENVVIDGY
jgi:phosphoglycerate dehydrogenase-like enzyme